MISAVLLASAGGVKFRPPRGTTERTLLQPEQQMHPPPSDTPLPPVKVKRHAGWPITQLATPVVPNTSSSSDVSSPRPPWPWWWAPPFWKIPTAAAAAAAPNFTNWFAPPVSPATAWLDPWHATQATMGDLVARWWGVPWFLWPPETDGGVVSFVATIKGPFSTDKIQSNLASKLSIDPSTVTASVTPGSSDKAHVRATTYRSVSTRVAKALLSMGAMTEKPPVEVSSAGSAEVNGVYHHASDDRWIQSVNGTCAIQKTDDHGWHLSCDDTHKYYTWNTKGLTAQGGCESCDDSCADCTSASMRQMIPCVTCEANLPWRIRCMEESPIDCKWHTISAASQDPAPTMSFVVPVYEDPDGNHATNLMEQDTNGTSYVAIAVACIDPAPNATGPNGTVLPARQRAQLLQLAQERQEHLHDSDALASFDEAALALLTNASEQAASNTSEITCGDALKQLNELTADRNKFADEVCDGADVKKCGGCSKCSGADEAAIKAKEEIDKEIAMDCSSSRPEATENKARFGDDAGGGGGTGNLTFTQQVEMISYHNQKRTEHCAPNLTWSVGIAMSAQAFADTCPCGHSSSTSRGGNGENAAWGQTTPTEAMEAWYSEMEDYTFQDGGKGSTGVTGHFTQMVWKSTQAFGCGYKSDCPTPKGSLGRHVWVCQYSPVGNTEGLYVENVRPKSGPGHTCTSRRDAAVARLKRLREEIKEAEAEAASFQAEDATANLTAAAQAEQRLEMEAKARADAEAEAVARAQARAEALAREKTEAEALAEAKAKAAAEAAAKAEELAAASRAAAAEAAEAARKVNAQSADASASERAHQEVAKVDLVSEERTATNATSQLETIAPEDEPAGTNTSTTSELSSFDPATAQPTATDTRSVTVNASQEVLQQTTDTTTASNTTLQETAALAIRTAEESGVASNSTVAAQEPQPTSQSTQTGPVPASTTEAVFYNGVFYPNGLPGSAAAEARAM